jgi:hypothetical protein
MKGKDRFTFPLAATIEYIDVAVNLEVSLRAFYFVQAYL